MEQAKIFLSTPRFWRMFFYDFFRLILKSAERIYSVRRQACKKNKYAKRKMGEWETGLGVV